jgi:capsular polysaccharide biosynthesis protein
MGVLHLDHDNADFKSPYKRVADFLDPYTLEYVNPESGLTDGVYCHSRHDYLIPNCLVDLVTGLVFVDGNLVAESSPWPEANLRMSLSRYRKLIPARRLLAPLSKLKNIVPSMGFYHWLIEQLPVTIHQLQLVGREVEFAVYEDAPSYVLDFVEMLKLKVQFLPRFVRFSEFMLTSYSPTTGWPRRHEASLVRSLIPAGLSTPAQPISVYVSRRNATRSPYFEEELEGELTTLGWKVVDNQKLKLQEQIEVFSQASVIAGVHGAGLVSQVWMPSHGNVVEISPPETRNCMAILASELGHKFQRIGFSMESATKSENCRFIRDQMPSLL